MPHNDIIDIRMYFVKLSLVFGFSISFLEASVFFSFEIFSAKVYSLKWLVSNIA